MPPELGPAPALRVVSCITGGEDLLTAVEEHLVRAFGPVATTGGPFPFELTDYYRDEMGSGLARTWFAFRELCEAETLPEARRRTAEIETRFAENRKRRVNLDPGYLDLGKLVLASHKEAPEKIYLGRGVWAHTCLAYRFGRFCAPEHSFPDFKDGRFDAFFLSQRNALKIRLRDRRASGPASPDPG